MFLTRKTQHCGEVFWFNYLPKVRFFLISVASGGGKCARNLSGSCLLTKVISDYALEIFQNFFEYKAKRDEKFIDQITF